MGYRDAMEISKFQQAGIVKRKTETNRNGESPTFDEEREDRQVRENKRVMSISSRPFLSANFHVPAFYHVSVSFPLV